MTNSYEKRLLRVIDHIHANPAGDLSLDTLADIAAMSRFHWHRVFRAMTGETCAQAVRRIRLHLAASEIVWTDGNISAIAVSVGYGDRDSFDRAFAVQYGLSPAAFRRRGTPVPLVKSRKGGSAMFPVDIKSVPSRRLVGLPHRGAYFRISEAFSRLDVMIAARGLYPQLGAMIGVFYDDVSVVPEAELQSFAAFELAADLALPEGMEERTLPGGDHAVLHYKGPYARLPEAYDYLFGTWLAGSGREPADTAAYEVYLNTPLDTAPDDLLTQIHLPLRG
ncbi:AraC family transcriptional regulator [Pseudooceanicola atlanticus]|uniref:AraC family transcriptional regulator n=1 Tax=Pseudooceanicola atlanticus TaxID=1461694 RepID=A0A0A0EAM2_9RHOB|nr:AraC family transcriptional regulator [Pseudooceanicola atlanticus]KGM47138.1 AraC family transcriptional regulator [Pseudooceanicola atlanticus]